jgi:hypothetical protein
MTVFGTSQPLRPFLARRSATMAEGKAGPKSPGVPDRWESDSSPDDFRNCSTPGLGATTGDRAGGAAGEGTSGGGRGTDYAEPPRAISGETQPEFPPEGWGEAGENYPPTRGPVPDRD